MYTVAHSGGGAGRCPELVEGGEGQSWGSNQTLVLSLLIHLLTLIISSFRIVLMMQEIARAFSLQHADHLLLSLILKIFPLLLYARLISLTLLLKI